MLVSHHWDTGVVLCTQGSVSDIQSCLFVLFSSPSCQESGFAL